MLSAPFLLTLALPQLTLQLFWLLLQLVPAEEGGGGPLHTCIVLQLVSRRGLPCCLLDIYMIHVQWNLFEMTTVLGGHQPAFLDPNNTTKQYNLLL